MSQPNNSGRGSQQKAERTAKRLEKQAAKRAKRQVRKKEEDDHLVILEHTEN
jgi:hypothetical protein